MSPAEIRAFLPIIHNQAARVTAGLSEQGLMTLVRIHPDSGDALPERFRVGDVETMTQVAVAHAEAGFNVYIETRTVRPGLRGKTRGAKADTQAVFALVRDNDAYGKGKSGTHQFAASLIVESSPGSSHD